jgi:hypothetical protein
MTGDLGERAQCRRVGIDVDQEIAVVDGMIAERCVAITWAPARISGNGRPAS